MQWSLCFFFFLETALRWWVRIGDVIEWNRVGRYRDESSQVSSSPPSSLPSSLFLAGLIHSFHNLHPWISLSLSQSIWLIGIFLSSISIFLSVVLPRVESSRTCLVMKTKSILLSLQSSFLSLYTLSGIEPGARVTGWLAGHKEDKLDCGNMWRTHTGLAPSPPTLWWKNLSSLCVQEGRCSKVLINVSYLEHVSPLYISSTEARCLNNVFSQSLFP